MLNLRLKEGFKLSEFKDRFQKDFLENYSENINKINDYVELKGNNFKVKDKYLYVLDIILLSLLKFWGVWWERMFKRKMN